ncbi:hypothetical protein BC628DRAFT_1410315 [Trametes gibbosa]|nr:hypothetical protein BC628DRAFT_1410315 [Trametes gibbosa]
MHHRISCVVSATALLCLVCSTDRVSAVQANVTWISPSDGDTYGSGDTLVGRWSADKAVVSPSFRICMIDGDSSVSSRSEDDAEGSGDDDEGDSSGGSCGGAVWPTIGQSDGSYFVHMALPNVSSVAQCYLEMVDDFGDKMASPTFSFGVSADDTTSSEAADDPSSTATSSDVETPSTSVPPSSSSDAPLQPPPNTPQTSQTPQTPQVPEPPQTPQTPLELDESHVPVPTAAYAVPLSLVISVILAAGGLSVHQRRKLQNERQREHATLQTRTGGGAPLSRHSTLSFAGFVGLGAHPGSSRRGGSGGGSAGAGRQAESRSTSVSMMRAWRRDVSRHERRPAYATRPSDSDATLAWRAADDDGDGDDGDRDRDDDDRYGAGGGGKRSHFTAIPRREARRPTREPFQVHAGHGRARPTTVPAVVFRAAVSPVFPSTDSWGGDRERDADEAAERRAARGYRYEGEEAVEEEWGRLERRGWPLVDPGVVDRRGGHPPRTTRGGAAYLNASVNDTVVERYLSSSPVPRSPGGPPQSIPVSVSRPERLHVRRYAEDGEERELRRAPRDPERDLYDTVAKRISRDSQ